MTLYTRNKHNDAKSCKVCMLAAIYTNH